MKITVGSTNEAKVLAVKEVLRDSPNFSHAQILPVSVASDVSNQPLSLQETIQGAKNRAKNAFHNCTYSIGIESGLMETADTWTGFLHICICCIYDGTHYYTGLSTGFEIPPQILDLVLNNHMDLSEACLHSGISNNPKIGSTEGMIGILTKGKVDRKEYSKQCVMTALLQLENTTWYASRSSHTSLTKRSHS